MDTDAQIPSIVNPDQRSDFQRLMDKCPIVWENGKRGKCACREIQFLTSVHAHSAPFFSSLLYQHSLFNDFLPCVETTNSITL